MDLASQSLFNQLVTAILNLMQQSDMELLNNIQ